MAQIVPTSPHPPLAIITRGSESLNWVRCETEASGDTGGSGGGGQGYWTVAVVDAAAVAVDTAAAPRQRAYLSAIVQGLRRSETTERLGCGAEFKAAV